MRRNWNRGLALELASLLLTSMCACGTVHTPKEPAYSASAAVSSAEAELQRSAEQAVIQHISEERNSK